MNFSAKYRCPYYDKPNESEPVHNYYLRYNSLREEKKDWIAKLRESLVKHHTPPNLRKEILDRIYSYYDYHLREFKNEESMNRNRVFDSSSDLYETNKNRRDKRKTVESESENSTEEESSLSSS